ncbi:MAG TPA: Hpt domain-containing protein [Acidobacteriaceae bacterium]|jgi:HPt (histidine-containing phosphotransfer) domain-containing protein|nr:Hpt domain-containing protein [Acidobacteriaceae bacterium]
MNEAAAEKIASRLAELWQSSRPTILERMDTLHATANALSANALDQEARDRGREAAHKLSGVLGIFGLPEGSEIASALEEQLQSPTPLLLDDLVRLQGQIADLDAVIASKSAQ